MLAAAIIVYASRDVRPSARGFVAGGARRRIKQAVLAVVSRRRLSPQQFWTMVAIWEHDGMTLCALAERQRMDAPTASRIVEALRRRGFVRMEADRADRRRRYLHLTSRGRALARALHPLAARTRHAVEAGFSEAEKEALRAMLLRVIANVDGLCGGLPEADRSAVRAGRQDDDRSPPTPRAASYVAGLQPGEGRHHHPRRVDQAPRREREPGEGETMRTQFERRRLSHAALPVFMMALPLGGACALADTPTPASPGQVIVLKPPAAPPPSPSPSRRPRFPSRAPRSRSRRSSTWHLPTAR